MGPYDPRIEGSKELYGVQTCRRPFRVWCSGLVGWDSISKRRGLRAASGHRLVPVWPFSMSTQGAHEEHRSSHEELPQSYCEHQSAQTCSFKRISWTYTCTYSIFELCIYYNLCFDQRSLYSSLHIYDCMTLNDFEFESLCMFDQVVTVDEILCVQIMHRCQ